jgi:mono/diheme cytochrome c family protein
MMRTLLIIVIVVVSGFSRTVLAQAAVQPSPAGSIEKGRLGFVKVGCAQCHGREAQGSPTTGPRLGPNGLPYAAFARYVRAPRLQMPPYTEKVLSDADLADLYAFAQSRPKAGTPPALK